MIVMSSMHTHIATDNKDADTKRLPGRLKRMMRTMIMMMRMLIRTRYM